MRRSSQKVIEEAMGAYQAALCELLSIHDISEAELGRRLKKKQHSATTKTVNNIVKTRHPSQIDKLAEIADTFDIPLWVMLIPGLPKELLQKPKCDRLAKLIRDYISGNDDDRTHSENIASAYANLRKRS